MAGTQRPLTRSIGFAVMSKPLNSPEIDTLAAPSPPRNSTDCVHPRADGVVGTGVVSVVVLFSTTSFPLTLFVGSSSNCGQPMSPNTTTLRPDTARALVTLSRLIAVCLNQM